MCARGATPQKRWRPSWGPRTGLLPGPGDEPYSLHLRLPLPWFCPQALDRKCPAPSPSACASNLQDRAEGNRSEEHTSELQSLAYLVCRLLLEKKKMQLHSSTAAFALLS